MYILYTYKYIYALFHLYTNVWTILNINAHLNDYTSYMNSNLFLPSKRISLPTLYLLWLHPHIDLSFDVSFEFFFSHSCWCFLEAFQKKIEIIVIWYCTFSMLEFFLEVSKFVPLNFYVVFQVQFSNSC